MIVPVIHLVGPAWDWYFYGSLIRPTWSPAELTFMLMAAIGLVLNLFAGYDAQADLHFLAARRLNGARQIVAVSHRRAALVRGFTKGVFMLIGLSAMGNPPPAIRTNTPKVLTLGFIAIICLLTWNDAKDRIDRARLIATLAARKSAVDPDVDAVLTIDTDSRILAASKGVASIFGYDPSDLVGQRLSVLLPPREWEYHRQNMEQYLATSVSHTLGRPRTIVGLDADGEAIPLEVTFLEIGFGAQRQFMAIVRRAGGVEREQVHP